MTDKENIYTKDLENILSKYLNFRLLQAENRQCYASLQTTLANIIIISSDIVAKSLEVGNFTGRPDNREVICALSKNKKSSRTFRNK